MKWKLPFAQSIRTSTSLISPPLAASVVKKTEKPTKPTDRHQNNWNNYRLMGGLFADTTAQWEMNRNK